MNWRARFMMQMGKWILDRERTGADPAVALDEAVARTARARAGANPGLADSGDAGNDIYRATTSRDWALSGFPLLVPSHRLAASLMATSMPPELVPDVAVPWPVFGIIIPGDLGDTLVDGQFEFVAVRADADGYVLLTEGARCGTSIAAEAKGLGGLLQTAPSQCQIRSVHGDSDLGPGGPLDRLWLAISRLVIGLCIELDQPKMRVKIGEGPPKKHKMRSAGDPVAWSFQLTRDVKVDCRPWVHSYIRGGTHASPNVQTLVRGHHKRQPFGPGRTERKWIHIEPYWRGPEDAPIAVRSHLVEGRS